jgi:hypothetical protein
MELTNDVNLFDLRVDQQAASYLSEAAKWARFLAILGFILCGLMALGSFFGGAYVSETITTYLGSSAVFGGVFSTIVYLGFTLLLFFPTLYLYKFAAKLKNAVRSNDQQTLEIALKNLKSFFKFHGIFAIIVLSFYALVIVFAIVGGLVGRH